MKHYETPQAELVVLHTVDIIAISGGGGSDPSLDDPDSDW